MRWTCFCGKEMSNTLCPNPNGYVVFTEEEWDEIGNLTDDNDLLNYDDIPRNKIDAYVCPDCGRIMIFKTGADGKYEERFLSYAPEPKSPLEKLFSESAWKEYAELWAKERNEISSLSESIFEEIRKGPDGEVVETFHDEEVRIGQIGDYSYRYIHNTDSDGIVLIDTVRTENLGAHNRIRNAVTALDGELALDDLPQYFRERLLANDNLEAKAGIFEAIVSIKEWV
ncbi:MAG: hypothetical protein IJ821_06215 [Lachnospiraceae bacterium]|nr:hypothetical protein [Lachnospiraceae bacterium]